MCQADLIKTTALEAGGLKKGRMNPTPGPLGHGNAFKDGGRRMLQWDREDDGFGMLSQGGEKPSEVKKKAAERERRTRELYTATNDATVLG